MKYSIYTDLSRKNKQGEYDIYLAFNYYGTRFRISTGLSAQSKLISREFPKKENNSTLKTARLMRICADVDKYIITHPITPYNEQKRAIRAIITGKEKHAHTTLVSAMRKFMEMKANNSTKGVYLHTIHKIEDFDPSTEPNAIDTEWLQQFTLYLERQQTSINGISKHMRNIRAVLNNLLDKGEIQSYAFRRFHIKTEKHIPYALTAEQIAKMRDFPCEPWQIIHRDLFMLSFYLCGMNAGDLLLCPSITNGRMQYKRRKTGKVMDIPIVPEAMEIIQRYKGKKQLLMPMDNNSDYHFFVKRWNRALKTIGTSEIVPDKVGRMRKIIHHPLFPEITTYTARYSFASIAASMGIPHETIALCLGHSWADVTERYIVYDTKRIDEAVQKVVGLVRNTRGK